MALPNGLLEVLPEDFYFDKVKPLMEIMMSKIKFDDVMVVTLEEVINKANGHAVHKEYEELAEDFNPISFVLLDGKSQYLKTRDYVSASLEEKDLISQLSNLTQQLLTIIQCTRIEKPVKEVKSPQRIGYDEEKQQNILQPKELQTPNEKENL